MNKVRQLLVFICIAKLVIFILASCGKDEEVADELIYYYNEEWAELEKKRSETLNEKQKEILSIERRLGKDIAGDFLEEELLPAFADFLETEKSVSLKHEEVQELHQILIEADQFAYDLLKKEGVAYYRGKNDGEVLVEENKELNEKYDEFFDHRDTLMKKYKLQVKEELTDGGVYKQIMSRK